MNDRRYWTPEKIRRLSVFVIVVTIPALLLAAIIKTNDPDAAINSGDFLAFYSAAKIVQQGQGKRLYDWQYQFEMQQPYRTDSLKQKYYYPYAYPPFFAYFLQPFAAVSPQAGKWIWTGLMLFALAGSVIIGRRYASILNGNLLPTAAFFILFMPVFTGVVGAQNIALSMFLYSLILWSISQNKRYADWLCGVALGLWLYKPQYPLILIPFFLIGGYGYVIAGFAAVAVVEYLLGSFVCGFDWPFSWLASVFDFASMDDAANANRMISISGFTESLAPWLNLGAAGDKISHLIALLPSALLFLWLVGKFWDVRKADDLKRRIKFQRMLQLAGPALLLISPHTLFYDLGLCFFSCVPYVKLEYDRSISFLILLLLFISLSTAARDVLPFQPLFFVVIGTLVFLSRRTA